MEGMKMSNEKSPESGFPPETRRKKRLAPKEMHVAKLMYERGMSPVAACRMAMNWACESGSKEEQKAKDLGRSDRIVAKIKEMNDRDEAKLLASEQAKASLRVDFGEMHKGNMREYAFRVLETLRDNDNAKAADRFNAPRSWEGCEPDLQVDRYGVAVPDRPLPVLSYLLRPGRGEERQAHRVA